MIGSLEDFKLKLSPKLIVGRLRWAAEAQRDLTKVQNDVSQADVLIDEDSLEVGLGAVLAAHTAGLLKRVNALEPFWRWYDDSSLGTYCKGGYFALPQAARAYFASSLDRSQHGDDVSKNRLNASVCNQVARFLDALANEIDGTSHSCVDVLVARLEALTHQARHWFDIYLQRKRDVDLKRIDPKDIYHPSYRRNQMAMRFLRAATPACSELADDILRVDPVFDVVCLRRFSAAGGGLLSDLEATWFMGLNAEFDDLRARLGLKLSNEEPIQSESLGGINANREKSRPKPQVADEHKVEPAETPPRPEEPKAWRGAKPRVILNSIRELCAHEAGAVSIVDKQKLKRLRSNVRNWLVRDWERGWLEQLNNLEQDEIIKMRDFLDKRKQKQQN